MERKLLSLVLISGVLSGFVAPSVSAADTDTPQAEVKSELPPDPGATTAPVGLKETTLPPDPSAPMGAATTTVSDPATSAPSPPKPSGGVNPGPLEGERQQMLANINAAEELGVGAKGYMAAFKFMEEEVAAGATQETVQKRLDSLRKGLTDQLERKQALKERPAASAAPAFPGGGGGILMPAQDVPPSLRYGSGAGASLASPELAKQLSEKYGNKLPPGMSTETIKSQMQNPQAREMLKEKLKSNPQYMDLIKQFLNK